MEKNCIQLFLAATGFVLVSVRTAYAHGFGERYDLPIPLWLYLLGAGAAVGLSFAVMGIFMRGTSHGMGYWRYDLMGHRWFRWTLASKPVIFLLKVLSLSLLGIVLISSLWGNQRPMENISVVFTWVIWWVGFGFFVSFVGDLWLLVNPWKVSFDLVERLLSRWTPNGRLNLGFRYPAKLGLWPAAALFFVFIWVENIFPNSAVPSSLGVWIVAYSFVTWFGMAFFGKHVWLNRAEAFNVLYIFMSGFSPTEVRIVDGNACDDCPLGCSRVVGDCINCSWCLEKTLEWQINIRPYAIGLARHAPIGMDGVSFVILMLAGITFDGFSATPIWYAFELAALSLSGALGPLGMIILKTLWLAGFSAMFLGIYSIFAVLIRYYSRDNMSWTVVAPAFVLSLVPIALAYNVAHFLSFFLIQGQLVIPLLSDPLGWGWDLFGTGGYMVNIAIINARFAWLFGVGSIVVGHIVAVFLSHAVSLRLIGDREHALRSQYPMIVLMVIYTVVSLWIIAQPIVE